MRRSPADYTAVAGVVIAIWEGKRVALGQLFA
jgi:hypothetical protein